MRAKRCLDDRNRVFLSLFVCLLVLCVSGCNKSESERYLQLLQEQGITDNTQNHLQNCDREFVQVSPNGVFMSRVKSQHDMALYQLEDGKYKKIAEQAYGFFESEGKVYYYDEENLYISAGRYVIEGDYSTSRRDSKWNGTWKIRLSDMEKDKWDLEKISDQSYSKFYCIKNQLFDEKFELIEIG